MISRCVDVTLVAKGEQEVVNNPPLHCHAGTRIGVVAAQRWIDRQSREPRHLAGATLIELEPIPPDTGAISEIWHVRSRSDAACVGTQGGMYRLSAPLHICRQGDLGKLLQK